MQLLWRHIPYFLLLFPFVLIKYNHLPCHIRIFQFCHLPLFALIFPQTSLLLNFLMTYNIFYFLDIYLFLLSPFLLFFLNHYYLLFLKNNIIFHVFLEVLILLQFLIFQLCFELMYFH